MELDRARSQRREHRQERSGGAGGAHGDDVRCWFGAPSGNQFESSPGTAECDGAAGRRFSSGSAVLCACVSAARTKRRSSYVAAFYDGVAGITALTGKVVRGANLAWLLQYLYGPGKANEQTDRI